MKEPLYFVVLVDDTHLAVSRGDILAVDLRRARMWTANRILPPNYGYLAGLQAEGRIEWLTPSTPAWGDYRRPAFPLRVVG